MSELLTKQLRFTACLASLIDFAYKRGYGLTLGDAWDADGDGGHMKGSLHKERLAIDLNLFTKDDEGKWMWDHKGTSDAWFSLGLFWETVDPDASWGGRFGDSNHFSFRHGGKK